MSARSIAFTIRIDTISDWCVGSGSGRQGALDSVVERDSDGLPYVPGTTLRGLWRDAGEQVAFALDHDATDGRAGDPAGVRGPWCVLLDHLFGSHPAIDGRGAAGHEPMPGRLILADTRLHPDLRAALRDGTDTRGNPWSAGRCGRRW
ncbi:MAG: RAMP superfamily CRISPR-associated protein [Xanthobacteraceae bacterium]|nr:RAMP superfamily CRISPR-associated protein [Xanthobacteraceae bacterium]